MNDRAESTLAFLMEGNRRFAGSLLSHPHQDSARRVECTDGQKPIAALVGCADSRVPPEVIFDCGIGDIFIVRNAGTVLDNATIASVEYAVDHLNVPLVVILGHTLCGAVTAAMNGVEALGELGKLLKEITSDCHSIGCSNTDSINATVKRYTTYIARKLGTIRPVLQPAVEKGKCAVVPACYSLESGEVELLEK